MGAYNASYTEGELPGLNLPGYRRAAGLDDVIGNGDTDWQPVLSLSIFAVNPQTSALDVLTAIRREGTPTHPHVVSTPTGRFPQAFQAPLVASLRHKLTAATRVTLSAVSAQSRARIASFGPSVAVLPNRGAPLPFVAHELLARKLGMTEGLQRTSAGRPVGTVSLAEMSIGFSYVGDVHDGDAAGHPLWEPLLMFAAVMRLDDRRLIPRHSPAYRNLSWVPSGRFIAGHRRRDPRLLIPGLDGSDEASVCVRGLCLLSTGSVLRAGELRGHLGLRRDANARALRQIAGREGREGPESPQGARGPQGGTSHADTEAGPPGRPHQDRQSRPVDACLHS